MSRQQVTIGSLPLTGGTSATVYAVRVGTPAGPETVLAALPLSGVAARVTQATDVTAGSCALALLVVGIVAWLTAGRVLRPVERMRARAEAIAASADPSGRLPRPGTDELGRLAETLNAMLASLESSASRQRRFVADAAHELRTPLAGLTAALEVAQRHPRTSRDTLIAELLAGHRRLSRTLNDLLVLAVLDGHAQEAVTPVDLAGVVTDCSRRSVPHGVSLHAGLLDKAVVAGSESQLSRMVTNLVDNALRYARGTVELAVTASGRWAFVSVTDAAPEYQHPTGTASGTGSSGSTTTAPRQAAGAASASPSSGKSPPRMAAIPRSARPTQAPARNS
jgi:signal transduction histidine kinase